MNGDTIAGSVTNNLTLLGSVSLSVGTSLTATLSAPVAGSVGLTKTGAGTLLLTAASNPFTGTTTVNGGTLVARGVQASTPLSLSGGTFELDAGAGGVLPTSATLTLGTVTFGKGSFILNNTTASGATSQTLASLTVPNQTSSDNSVQVTRTAAQPVSLIFTALSNNSSESGNVINFITSDVAGGGVNGTGYKIVLADQAVSKITKQNAYFNGGDFAVYDIAVGTGLNGFVRGIPYGTDEGTATSAGGASFAAGTAQEITGSITAQPTVSLAVLTTGTLLNGSLKIVGASNVTMSASDQTLTIYQTGNTGASGLLKTGGGTSVLSGGSLSMSAVQTIFRVDGDDSRTLQGVQQLKR